MAGPAKKTAQLHAIAGTRPKGPPEVPKTPPGPPSGALEVPKKPPWVKGRHAAASWNRLAAYMTEQGTLNQGNFDALASLCAVNGEIAESRMKGSPVIPSLLAQQARMMIDLRLTGCHSGGSAGGSPPSNPFAGHGRRPAGS